MVKIKGDLSMFIYLAMIDSPEEKLIFEIIYERYKGLMFYTANSVLGDTRDSEDIVHDAFFKIIEIIDEIDDPNKAIDLYRKRKAKTVVPFEEEYIGVPEQSLIDQVEENDRLVKAIALLFCQSVQKLYPVSSRGNSRPAA